MNVINDNFRLLPPSYLFSTVGKRVREYAGSHPEADVIRMDIGDVTRPICEAARSAMHRAVDDLGDADTFFGYGPEQGYEFLRRAISEGDYAPLGVKIDVDEIFISDGAKSDLANLSDLFDVRAKVAVTDPVYPVYVDSNVIAGRCGSYSGGRWSNLIYLDCRAGDGFVPELPKERPDVIYLCFPNNPTGASITRDELRRWVEYARREGALIIYDSAYEAFVNTPGVVRSIYEIEGAEEVAIECRSYSKTAGFTGLRCGYTVVPKALKGSYPGGGKADVNALWRRRQCTKFNGASYVIQRGAEALYTEEGRRQVMSDIGYYRGNARLLREGLTAAGLTLFGGIDSPYIWLQAPDGMESWEMFETLLTRCGVTSTPGVGFGRCGEGYVRLTAFNTHDKTAEAVRRIADSM